MTVFFPIIFPSETFGLVNSLTVSSRVLVEVLKGKEFAGFSLLFDLVRI